MIFLKVFETDGWGFIILVEVVKKEELKNNLIVGEQLGPLIRQLEIWFTV